MDQPAQPRRLLVPCVLAAVAFSAVALARSSHRGGSLASTTFSAAGARARLELDDDELYTCTMGKPDVATEYEDGSWGTIEGEWYVVAGKFPHSSDAAGDCCRMRFEMPNSKKYNQHMLYQNDDDNGVVQYYWNFSGNTEYHNTTGLWYNHGESDDNGAITYDGFWSNVFLVGTYNDARWFGWYECGEGVHVTEDGIPFILSEDKDAHDDDDFTSMVEEKMKEALTFSDDDDEYSFTVYKQDDCDCKCGRASRIATPLFSRAALQIPRRHRHVALHGESRRRPAPLQVASGRPAAWVRSTQFCVHPGVCLRSWAFPCYGFDL